MVKMPDPMTAPMPSEVRLSHPRDFFNRTSAFSESDMSWSIPLQRKSSDPTHALRSRPGKPEAQNYALYISGMDAPQCTPRRPATQPACAAVFVVALYADNSSDSKARMADFAPQHGIGIAAAFCSGASEGSLGWLAARSGRCLLGSAAHPAQEFLWGIRILGVGLVAVRLANLRHGSANRVHQFTGNFRQKTRRQGSAQLLLIAEDAPIDGARQSKRLPCPGHSDVNQATFLFDSFFFTNGSAVRANAFFHASKEHVIEFQALGAVQGNKGNAGFALKLIGVAYQCGGI